MDKAWNKLNYTSQTKDGYTNENTYDVKWITKDKFYSTTRKGVESEELMKINIKGGDAGQELGKSNNIKGGDVNKNMSKNNTAGNAGFN